MAKSKNPRIGFLGAGKMATALAKGWIDAGAFSADEIVAADPSSAARSGFQNATGAKAQTNNRKVVESADTIVLAVKPQLVHDVLSEVAESFSGKHLLLSIAAGISLATLKELVGRDVRIIRIMPNTPCLIGASASAYAAGSIATADDLKLVGQLLNHVGKAFQVPEKQLDAVTGLSGSGPAFIYVLIEALSDGGVRMGLPRDVAQSLAAQTVLGSAKMVLETEWHPAQLKDMVASPGGTTIAGLHELERGGLRGVVMNAVEAASKRASELGQISKD